MWLLRSLMYMVITPFHPIHGFSKSEEDVRNNRIRRFAFWGGIGIYLVIYYFFVRSIPRDYSLPAGFHVGEFIFIRFFGFVGAFTCLLVIGMIFKDNVANFGRILTLAIGMTMFLEIGFLVASYYFPEHYFTIKTVTYIWRTTVIALGIYIMADFNMKQAIIMAVGCTLPLYFAHLDVYYNLI